MAIFPFRPDKFCITSLWLMSAAFRSGRWGIGLVPLGALVACQSGEATTTVAAAAAPDRPDSAAADGATGAADEPATQQGTATFSIDGQPESGVLCGVVKTSTKSGFRLTFGAEPFLDVSVADNGQLPLAVGKFPILDWFDGIQVQATLPARFNGESREGRRTYSSFMGIEESSPTDFFHVYDWGAGVQRLRGREVGQVVFTRLSNGTADGSFQSAVYIQVGDVKPTKYQGQDRILHSLKEHQLKGAFKNVPVFDIQKGLRGGQ